MHESYELALGEWGYHHKYEDILHDLIFCSGVIIEESPNIYSFGHLTFQEHLAGEFIFEQNHSIFSIKSKMRDDWWREPLIFYASRKGDLTDLITDLCKSQEVLYYSDLVMEMLFHAPYTSPGARDMLFELIQPQEKFE